ncbi:hypothetical protein IMSHALPRED_006774 [Imshaugia aleurites]|uniref:SprT-like domain-containing protein n=1 Tax=Imshaugia aleurites TaxID=172621 RepID=A0A8H3FL29_9LECA|nr:hypothetical protein IMSHALPRED_006774 [Imshaugia aleurites]
MYQHTRSYEPLEQLFQQAFQPFSENTGTPYPCSQADINFHHRDIFHKPNKGPFVSSHQATTELMWQNDASRPVPSAEQAAIERLLQLLSQAEYGPHLGPDLAIKTFSDIDLIFFGGQLRGNVTVQWRNHHTIGDAARVFGLCSYRRGVEEGQCRILMNASMIFGEAPRAMPFSSNEFMFATMLHEMCHAYEKVRAPRDIEKSNDGHGKLFGTRISVVHKRAMRILGLWAIGQWETTRQHHVFIPHCEAGWGEDGRGHDDGDREGGKGTHGSSGKRGGGGRDNDDRTISGKGRVRGASGRPKRHHKGTDCIIM